MIERLLNNQQKPIKVCTRCGTVFSYAEEDKYKDTWSGGLWCVKCPDCEKLFSVKPKKESE